MKNQRNKKSIVVVGALVLALILSIVGTLSYLTRKTEDVTNTFVAASGLLDEDEGSGTGEEGGEGSEEGSNTDAFKLEESLATLVNGSFSLNPNQKVTSNSYNGIVPLMTIPKDPTLTLNLAENVKAYAFVEVIEENKLVDYVFDNTKWKKLENTKGARGGELYLYIGSNQDGTIIGSSGVELDGVNLLLGNEVKAISSLNDKESKLIFNAYLCQADSFDGAAAAYSSCFLN